MNATTPVPATLSPTLQKADRAGVAASVLCAIHCALAPILLIALPSFGRVWAHPASHVLVAVFVVPLAVFSIRKGYRTHQKRWIPITASLGILLVLIGAMLPAFSQPGETEASISLQVPGAADPASSVNPAEASCERNAEGGTSDRIAATDESSPSTACVDDCCPSVQVDEAGATSLHIPPAAIVTTLGGLLLIAAHIGNLCSCGHACRASRCGDCG